MPNSRIPADRRILVVDDDPMIRSMLRRYLESEDMEVSLAETQAEACAALVDETIDLVLLDVNLKRDCGLELARHIQNRHPCPIIFISGRDDVIDKVVGLELGAEDYITKPFHLRELLARIRTVLRRVASDRGAVDHSTGERADDEIHSYSFAGWRYAPSARALTTPEGAPQPLTTGEADLLAAFLSAPNRPLSRDLLMSLQHGPNWAAYDRSVDTQVGRLRKKLNEDVAEPQIIKTIRGVGYLFAPKVSKSPI